MSALPFKILAPKSPFIKFALCICCIFLLTLLTQAGNAQAVVQGASVLARTHKLAEQGDVLAQFALGLAYDSGKGGAPQNYTKATYWFQKAAEQGDAEAQGNSSGQYALGLRHLSGIGVIRDDKKICDLFRASAEQGNKKAIEAYNGTCAK